MSITEPGLYSVPETDYHRDTVLAAPLGRSLSVSGAKVLLQCPAKFEHERRHPRPASDAMDLGSVAHELILRGGDNRITVIDAYDWRKKSDQEQRKTIRAKKLIAVNRTELREAAKIATAVRSHELASAILSEGIPEQSLYWVDEDTGVTRRGRIDWLRPNAIVDVKTCADASPAGFAKAAANLAYHQQAAWYVDGIRALTGEERPFIFVAVEKCEPYLVGVYTLDDEALSIGREKNRRALELFAECESSGVWPGYSTDIETLSLPRWATY